MRRKRIPQQNVYITDRINQLWKAASNIQKSPMSKKPNQCKKCGHNCHCNWDQCDCGCDVCDCGTFKEDIPSTFISPTNIATS